jgi:hypothetical protein
VLLLLLLLVLLQCFQHMLHHCQVAVHGGDMQHCTHRTWDNVIQAAGQAI